MDDITTSPQAMEAQLNELVRVMLRMQPRGEDVTVRDSEAQVAVTIAADGRLAKVAVEPRWSDKVEAGALETTILTTIAEAQLSASGLEADGPEPTDAEVAARRDEMTRRAEAVLETPGTDTDLQARIDNLPNLFDQLDDALQRLGERLQEVAEPVSLEEAAQLGLTEVEGVRFRSQNSMVTLTVNQGSVVDLGIHRNWVEGRSGIVISECFDQIIDQLNHAG
ncbi:hypothetical protein G7085_07405 [Tessaracoccus sp. HDW20]|uniref:hypothetical protein n=1 Tax=Tessaracoccus coleopterorum TaxID=2714950 RepID=UPI0018D462D3|nr:hypothetical protein [Tessaracoccus coleopterorum]NHB84493.1 hypothetical protein [Tessaracoccus coleopterorum]